MSTKSDLLFADLQKSVDFLNDVLNQPKNDYMRAAAIQAFEICFELSWKYLQSRLTDEGLAANSPRSTFRESGKLGLISDVESWLIFTDERNLTVHTYQPKLADEVYEIARQKFLPAARQMLQTTTADRET